MRTCKDKMRVPLCLLALVALVSLTLAGCGQNSAASTASKVEAFCTQKAVIADEQDIPLLSPDNATVAIPQGEPQIVATVNNQPVFAKQLEMQVQYDIYQNQRVLAQSGPNIPPNLQAQLTSSPAKLRQMILTNMIDKDIWLTLGQQDGEEASVADAQKQLKQTISTLDKLSANDPARFQLEAFLCVNHMTEASYPIDPRMIQRMRDDLTALAARNHARSMLVASAQQNDGVQESLNTYVQSLWGENNVKVFLAGFVPLRMDGQSQ